MADGLGICANAKVLEQIIGEQYICSTDCSTCAGGLDHLDPTHLEADQPHGQGEARPGPHRLGQIVKDQVCAGTPINATAVH